MQITSFSLLALFAAGAFALPAAEEPATDLTARGEGHIILARCSNADKPLCNGARHLGQDNCKCKGQIKPCGNWKCGWDGPRSIVSFFFLSPLVISR